MNRQTISANEDMVKTIFLSEGEHRVTVEFAVGTTGTATMKETSNKNNANATSLIDTPAKTGSGGFIHAGPCWVGLTIANLSGTITLSADKITT